MLETNSAARATMTASKFSQVAGGDLLAPRLHRSATRRTRSLSRVTRPAPCSGRTMAREPGASRDTAAPHVTPHVPRGAYPELKAGRKESDVHDDSPEQDDHEQDDDGWQHVCPCVSPSVNISVSRNRQRACLTKAHWTGRAECGREQPSWQEQGQREGKRGETPLLVVLAPLFGLVRVTQQQNQNRACKLTDMACQA